MVNRRANSKQAEHLQSNRHEFKRLIAFLAIPPIAEIDLVGPLSVFQAANLAFREQGREPVYRFEIVTSASDGRITGDCGLTLLGKHFSELPKRVDTLLVAGGTGSLQVGYAHDAVRWLRGASKRFRRLGSVCTGAYVLAATGLLDGRRATTHWRYCRQLAERHPLISVENTPIFVEDNGIYTSAGITAGMDLALELVHADCGSDTARHAARDMVIFLRRPGGQAQFSQTLERQTPERACLRELQTWILEHLAESLDVPRLAARAAMSERHFARVFRAEFKMTPARYVLLQRLEAARRELESTGRGHDEIAVRCGLGSAVNLHRAFVREFGVTPGVHRQQFSG